MDNIVVEDTSIKEEKKVVKKLWSQPWRYREGFLIALGILILGIIIEIISGGSGMKRLENPGNIIFLMVLVNIIFILHFYLKDKSIIRWLSSVPAAISSMTLLTFLVLILGFLPQNSQNMPKVFNYLGFTHITTSFPFAVTQVYFFITLGLVTLRRSTPFKGKNIGFMLNHAGLWITLASAMMGSGDLKRLNMTLGLQQDYNNVAYSSDKQSYRLKIALKLLKFNIEEYPPKLAIVNNKTHEIVSDVKSNTIKDEIYKGLDVKLNGWQIKVKEYFASSIIRNRTFVISNELGSGQSAFVSVYNLNTGKVREGWICSGSFILPYRLIPLDTMYSLGMTIPEPKKFTSFIEYITKEGLHDSVRLEVNKPFNLNGWKIYQSSYDTDIGRWSQTSVVELVYDKWLPFVYFGIFMMIAGAVYIFWIGRRLN